MGKDKCKNPEWQRITDKTYRLRVYRGWIVATSNEITMTESTVFVPDAVGYWNIWEEEECK